MGSISPLNILLGLVVLGTVGYVGVQAFTAPGLLQANTIRVTSTADILAEDGLCTLREAIIAANTDSTNETNGYGPISGECPAGSGDDIIEVPAGTYDLEIPGREEDAAFSGDLDITDNLTITGDGQATTIIDAKGIDRVFQILSSTTVEISGVTVQGGDTGGNGGGILNGSGDLTLTNSAVIGNSAERGGGIMNDDSLTVVDSTISHNFAVEQGGGINSFGTLTVTDSSVSDNTTSGFVSVGGGIHATGSLTITNSTISGNSSSDSAGGIFSSIGPLNLVNSTVNDNVTLTQGGAIVSSGSQHDVIDDSVISGNSAEQGGGIWKNGSLTITNSTISGNSAEQNDTFNFASTGGGVHSNFGTLKLIGSTVSNNSAAGTGSGIYNQFGTIEITNSTISGNTSEADGGGIANNRNVLTLISTTITDNSAAGVGGGVYGLSDGVKAIQTILANNEAPSSSDCFGTVTSLGHNLIGDATGCGLAPASSDLVGNSASPINPLLGPLQNNGGPTETHALLPGSTAIDHIPAEDCAVATDQRGVARPLGGRCDIGSYETEGEVVNHPPIADAGLAQTVECASADGALVSLDGTSSSDPDGDDLTFWWSSSGIALEGASSPTPQAFFPLGTTAVSLTVTDPEGLSDTDATEVTVLDTGEPTLAVAADPESLSPANHQYVPVSLLVDGGDGCGSSSLTISAVARSNEPDDAPGGGDGNTTGDIRVTTEGGDVLLSSNDFPEVAFDPIHDHLDLRAERSGAGDGRTYTITVTATDPSGNQTTATATVVVPHDQGEPNHSPLADAGPNQTVECATADGALVSLDGTGSSDPDSDDLTFWWSSSGIALEGASSPTPQAIFPLGTTAVSLTVTDPEGLRDDATTKITVLGSTPQGLSVKADPPAIWPANHKYVRIHLSVKVDDTCGASPTITAVARSSEPDNTDGDGNDAGDIKVTTAAGDVLLSSNHSPELAFDPIHDRLELRAERAGGGNGRTYTITVMATDASGNQTTATATVAVAHDQGKK